jgi:CheY-like chemotaxis protein
LARFESICVQSKIEFNGVRNSYERVPKNSQKLIFEIARSFGLSPRNPFARKQLLSFTLKSVDASLDVSFNKAADWDATDTSEMGRLQNVRVLIVDDDCDTCSVMSRLLIQTGAVVATATDVDSGLAEVQRFKPDILVSDIGMPDRDGYDLIREVRARGHSFQKLPAIALTALAAARAGFQVHVSKTHRPQRTDCGNCDTDRTDRGSLIRF